MAQLLLPIFPEGSNKITDNLSFEKRDGKVTYFHHLVPVFTHDEKDTATFRMITAQFCTNGYAKQVDIINAFGVPKISVLRAVKLYREEGPAGFYKTRKPRGPSVLTASVMALAQEKLDQGLSPNEVADQLSIKRDTFRKAVKAGRLHCPSTPQKKSL